MTPDQSKQIMRVMAGRLERPIHTHTDVVVAQALVERALRTWPRYAAAEPKAMPNFPDER